MQLISTERISMLRRSGVAQALLLAALLLAVYALQAPAAVAPPLADPRWGRGFDSVERDPAGQPFRWMRARGELQLPPLSTAPQLLALRLENIRPDGQPAALQLSQRAQLRLAVAPGARVYRLLLPGGLAPPPDTLTLTADTFRPDGDRRALSLVARGARMAPIAPGLPWWALTAGGLLALTALVALLLRSLAAPEHALPLAAAVAPALLLTLGPAAYGPGATVLAWVLAALAAAAVAVRRHTATWPYHEIALHRWVRADYLLAGALVLAAVALRVALAPHQLPMLNGDDYLTGSFAANILLRGWHALYFGHHTGALAAYLALPGFLAGGVNGVALLALPVALSAALVLALYGLGADLAGRWGGVTAALWFLLPAATALWWSMKPQPGYLEAIAFAALALWGTLRLLWGAPARRRDTLLMLGTALAATLAVWAGLVVASVLLLCAGLALLRWRRLPALPLAGYLGSLAIGLLLLVPTAVYIVERPGDNPLWWVAGRDTTGLPPGEALRGLLTQTLPLALGVARPFPLPPVAPALGYTILALAVAAAAFALVAALSQSRAALVPLGIAAAVTALFCFSSFNRLLSDVRYILPIYLALPLFAALLVAAARRRLGPLAGGLLLAAILAANAASGLGMFGIPRSAERGEALLARALAADGIAYVHSSYWIAQPLMVESGGTILASAMLGPSRVDYDERVVQAVLAAPPEQVALLLRADSAIRQALDAALAAQGATCHTRQVAGYLIYARCAPFPDIDALTRALPMGIME
jgi:hypothetical protein